MRLGYTLLALSVIFLLMATGCNWTAKHWGGTATINVPKGEKVVSVSWKDGSAIWYLTRKAKQGETFETLTYREDSNLGILSGTVVLIESAP